MVNEEFVCGQRWANASEPTLGLGIVVQVARFQVQILFPATGEMRTYAVENSPLRRVRFAVGDVIRSQDGEEYSVGQVSEAGGLITYHCAGVELPEAQLADVMSSDGPDARLLAGHCGKSSDFDLRLETLGLLKRYRGSPVRGYTGARMELLPHQLYIAAEVSGRSYPRALLADEVGLGKTIEACLILHRMLVCGRASRALIILPPALVHQWFVELLRRFNLSFSIFDEERCAASAEDNPFLDEQLVICALDFLVDNPRRALQALAGEWDLVIVDEAHHLHWSPESSGADYRVIEQFARAVPGLLLLTASPEQAGIESHFARLRLLDPQRYGSLDRFVEEHARYDEVAREAESLARAGKRRELEKLLDCYGPGRVMFRNTRSVVGGFPRRIPHLIELSASLDGVPPEWLWLAGFLRDKGGQKTLVVCSDAQDVQRLDDFLRARLGIDIASFHEQLPLLQCDRQAAWFAEESGPRVLLTSGMGGEGRNYQFASHLVLMDVPEDPELVEQRIGRLDRIGQRNDVHIYLPYVTGTRRAGVARWLHEGLEAFSRPLVGGYAIYQKYARRLDRVDDTLIAETRAEHRQLRHQIDSGRNILLELSSFRREVAEKIVADIRKVEQDETLEKFMLKVFEAYGVGVEKLSRAHYKLSADLLFCDEFPLPRERGDMQVTFDREYALSRPLVTLLSWDHPMVQGAKELIVGSELGVATVGVSKDVSGVVLQAVYVLEVLDGRRAEIEEFLPPEPIVVQVDDAAREVEHWLSVSGDAYSDILHEPAVRETFAAMVRASRSFAEVKAEKVVAEAGRRLRSVHEAEIERLEELRRINDHVTEREVDVLREKLAAFEMAIGTARLRLDAVRLVVPVGMDESGGKGHRR